PGGFSEGSFFTARMAELFPALRRAGDPGQAWCQALARSAPPGAHFAFISAPGYLQDHQVVAYLATGLRERGISSWIGKPEQLDWQQGEAFWLPARDRQPLAAIIRFYQAEWLAELPARSAWQHLLRGGRTLVANPIQALISESKRFPVLWDQLTTSLATWRALLPESRDPRGFNGASREWLLKQAYSNNGDAVILPENEPDWRWARLKARLRPNTWVAQRRFESLPFPTPIGPRHACVGVYTVNGQATGAYVRLSSDPVVDYRAIDAALLLMNDD
ncbi:MAG TPA: glutathionylspermidine synthase family protein, partial [Polyangiaceae bacterium]|nr:glutathionylspermidine synthase family protein [Polyangiaceae bacterium]